MTAPRPFNCVIGVVIPTRNEVRALPVVLNALPTWIDAVVVADYKSSDGTPEIARKFGATVVAVETSGYGIACLQALAALPPVDIVVFIDGDAADDVGQLSDLIAPIANNEADFLLGSRAIGKREPGALTPQQIFGNWLACTLMRWIWNTNFTDLGPFRAIRATSLDQLKMTDQNYGWTVEMQVKAAKHHLRCREIPANYRRRIGTSKVSGTISGSVRAGVKILTVIAREALTRR